MTDMRTSSTIRRKQYGCSVALGWLAVALILVWSSVGAAEVLNPGFETYYMGMPWPRQLPQNWWHTDNPSFHSKCTNLWSTEGALSAGLYSLVAKPVTTGHYQGFHQYVDLTGIGSIVFDVRLAAYPSGPFEHFEALFLVDGVPLWRKAEDGIYLNQQVNVAHMAGWHRLELRNTARDTGQFAVAYWTQWDNVRLVEGPMAIKASIRLDPDTLNLGSQGQWVTCYIELEAGYEAAAIDGASVTLGDTVAAYMGDQGWATPGANGENVSDFDSDGADERMVKFDRSAVQALIQAPQATVMVKGKMTGGTPFEGTGVIKVIDKGPKAK